jgi:serine/threonine protein kinase
MAAVYSAIDEKLGRRVAIKILHSHLSKNDDIRHRFHQEARSISSIDHPNIIKVFDFSGEESEQLWIVTEILYGVDLAEYTHEFPNKRLHPIVASLITREICRALSIAHRNGIIHRDVKPENIMVLDSGRVKLMDFGIAKVSENSNATQTGTFMGSPSYMSPEQIRGSQQIDQRTDIYSLSVLFYEITCGVLPYVGSSTADVIAKILSTPFKKPLQIMPSIPEPVSNIIEKGMQKNRNDRFSSIDHLARSLDQYLRSQGFTEGHEDLERYFRNAIDFEKKIELSERHSLYKVGTHATIIQSNGGTKLGKTTKSIHEKTTIKDKRTIHGVGTTKQTHHTILEKDPNGKSTSYKQNKQKRQIKQPTLTKKPTQYHQQTSDTKSTRSFSSQKKRAKKNLTYAARMRSNPRVIVHYKKPNNFLWNTILVASLFIGLVVGKEIFQEDSAKENQATNITSQIVDSKTKSEVSRKSISTNRNKLRVNNSEHKQTKESTNEDRISKQKIRRVRAPIEDKASNGDSIENKPRRSNITRVSTEQAPTSSRTIKPIAKQMATVTVRSFPDAKLYIDGKFYGSTGDPSIKQSGIKLPQGSHRISLKKSGFENANESIRLNQGENLNLSYVMIRESSTIRFTIRTNKLPAVASIDRIRSRGSKRQIILSSRTESLELEPGTYNIQVEHAGQKIQRTITLNVNSDSITFNANFN